MDYLVNPAKELFVFYPQAKELLLGIVDPQLQTTWEQNAQCFTDTADICVIILGKFSHTSIFFF